LAGMYIHAASDNWTKASVLDFLMPLCGTE
jgi:hypothetical protein